jgi:thiol-disulfide isomerase/thioredoxin
MKRALVAILIYPLFCIGQTNAGLLSSQEMGGVHFIDDLSWHQIQEKAKAENKYIFVDCFATWCGPCKAMDNKTYLDANLAEFVNGAFISVKMQCDTGKSDGKKAIARYADARQMSSEFHVNLYPTFLFFSPTGRLVHKGVGYQTPREFVKLAKDAMDPSRQYFSLLNLYRVGKIHYDDMPYLAAVSKKFDNAGLFDSIARSFIGDYLNQLPESEYFLRDLRSSDRVFNWLCGHFEESDSIMQDKGLSEGIVNFVIYKETVKPQLDIAQKCGIAPDWESMAREVSNRFAITNVNKVILKGKQGWYEYKKDWENFCGVAIERIEEEGIVKDTTHNNLELLNTFAFGIFQKSNDKIKLEKALSWSELTVSAITESTGHASNWLDTKANLLYKLGRTQEAIALETRAFERGPADKGIRETLEKMKAGKPTW